MISRFWKDIAVVAMYGVAAMVFYWPALFGGQTLLPLDNLWTMAPWYGPANAVPHNLLVSDMLLQNYPWKLILDQALQQRQLPLWNPYEMAGLPYLATGQTGALYPFVVLFLILGPLAAYGWYSALHQVLAGSLSYAFLRRLGIGRIGAAIGGFVFAFCFFLTVSYIWPMVLGAAVWLPLALWSLVGLAQAAASGKWSGALARDLPVGALAIGLSVLGGHLEITFYSTFAVGLFGIFLGGQLLRKRLQTTVAFGLAAGLAIGLGVLLAGVQLAPFLEVLRSNNRQGDTTYAQVISYALPKIQVFGLLMPDFFGNPTAHGYLDLTTFQRTPVGDNSLGQPTDPPHTIFWGTKNYVESGGYVGVVPLLLALVGIAFARSRIRWFFAGLAALSLLLAFGSPLYALIYYGLPFFSQLRTPFRWLYLFDFATAMLAGMGADALVGTKGLGKERPRPNPLPEGEGIFPFPAREGDGGVRFGLPQNLTPNTQSLVFLLPPLLGLAGLLGLVASLAVRHRSIGLVGRVLASRPELQRAFGSATMLYSYEFRNLAIFFGLLFVGGLLIALAVILPERLAIGSRGPEIARGVLGAALLLVVAVDLFHFGMPFSTKAPASILDQRVALNLPESPGLAGSRYASFGDPVALRANLGVLLGIPNVGGYDTIISRDYRQLWSLVEPAVDLPYNQIGRIHQTSSLQSPILDLLGVRYILSQTPLNDPSLRPVPQPSATGGAGVLVYERPSALPRAFVVGQARGVASSDAAFAAMAGPGFQPAKEVVLVGQADPGGGSGTAQITSYKFDQVMVQATTSGPAWLVLADANAPGWTATRDGTGTSVLTADGDLRAVYLPAAGSHSVVFNYHPFSLLVGGYVSFLALLVLALAASSPIWRRLLGHYAGQAERVMRNTSVPMATSFLNKAVDFGFAALMLRILGASSAGDYAFAIVLMGYFDIFTNFGLNALITREVARNRDQTGRYLSEAVALRLGFCALSVPAVLGIVVVGPRFLQMSVPATTAFLLLTLALIPGSLNGALSAVFNAYERNEVPAIIAVGTNFLRVALSTVALLAGAGIVGLAAIALFLNLLLAVTFVVAIRQMLESPNPPPLPVATGRGGGLGSPGSLRLTMPSLANLRTMIGESYPLFINNLLVTIFFKIDIPLLEAFQGALVVGYYAAAYKWLDGFLIIPSTLTFAVFPALSRLAEERGEGLRATYDVTLRILVCLAIPLSVIVTFLSGDLILLLGGPAFLPQSARALSILIWFMPFSFINGLTQYLLIAVNKQKFITLAFLSSAGFNLIANLIFIPRYSLYAASAITVLSEIVLMVPFLIEVRREIGWPNWTRAVGKPALAGLLMVFVAGAGRGLAAHVALLAGLGVYVGAILVLGVFTSEEGAILARITLRRRVREVATSEGN